MSAIQTLFHVCLYQLNRAYYQAELKYTWFTLDPADPVDANYDPDNDGNYDCSGAGYSYEPYTNFQEFYMITDEDLTSQMP